MSSRRNLSGYDFDQRSIQLHDHELLTTIGITNNKSSISCLIDNNAKQYKYGRSHAEIINAIFNIFKQQQLQAFQQLQKITHYHRDHTDTFFLPQALNHGNYSALSKFLARLKTNKIGAYVNLSLKESKGYFLKGATLLKPVIKIIKDRLRFMFARMKKNMTESILKDQRNILEELDKMSSIQDKDSINRQGYVFKKPRNSIRLTYTQIHLPRNKQQNWIEPISIKDLMQKGHERSYHLERVESDHQSGKVDLKINTQIGGIKNKDGMTKIWILNTEI